MPISLLHTLLQQPLQLILTIPQPTRTSSVRRHSLANLRLLNSLLLTTLNLLKQLNRLFGGNSVGDIAEINAANKLLRAHIGNNTPHRLTQRLSPEVPQSIDNSTQSEVDNTLLGTDPAQLAVRDEVAPGLAPVSGELVELLADDERSHEGDSSADDFIAAADGECLKCVNCGWMT